MAPRTRRIVRLADPHRVARFRCRGDVRKSLFHPETGCHIPDPVKLLQSRTAEILRLRDIAAEDPHCTDLAAALRRNISLTAADRAADCHFPATGASDPITTLPATLCMAATGTSGNHQNTQGTCGVRATGRGGMLYGRIRPG